MYYFILNLKIKNVYLTNYMNKTLKIFLDYLISFKICIIVLHNDQFKLQNILDLIIESSFVKTYSSINIFLKFKIVNPILQVLLSVCYNLKYKLLLVKLI